MRSVHLNMLLEGIVTLHWDYLMVT